MQRLALSPESEWVDLGRGVRVRVRPITTALVYAARKDPALADLPAGTDQEQIALVMGQSIARLSIVEWDGVGNEDGEVIDPTPETISALMDIWPLCQSFMRQCVDPVFTAEAEKKGSAPSPSGSSAGAPPTATPVGYPARTAHES